MSLFGLGKKKEEGFVPPVPPAGLVRLDEKLPPLPPLPGAATRVASPPSSLPPLPPLPSGVSSSLPPLPNLSTQGPNRTVASLPPLPPLPSNASPSPALPPLPAVPRSSSLPPLPSIPAAKPVAPVSALPPLPFKTDAPVTPSPPESSLSSAPNVFKAAPLPSSMSPQAPKLENSRLLKALEELTDADLDLGEDKPAIATIPKPVVPKPVLSTPVPIKDAPRPARAVRGPIFVSLTQFEEIFRNVRVAQEHLNFVQAHNEKLGMIEMQTKNNLDQLLTAFEHIQRSLLNVDEKLFKVN